MRVTYINADAGIPLFGGKGAAVHVRDFSRALTELGHSVLQTNPVKKLLFFILTQGAKHSHRVFTLQSKPGVHQSVGKLPGTREQQQPFSV